MLLVKFFILFNALIGSLKFQINSPLDFISNKNLVRDEATIDLKRIYIYTGLIKIAPSYAYIKCTSYESGNQDYESNAEIIKPENVLEDEFKDRLFYCDVPANSQLHSFEIISLNGSVLGCTNIYPTSNSVFWLDTKNYVDFENNTGWNPLIMKPNQFADYILKGINPNSESKCYGYNTYPYLKDAFIDNLKADEQLLKNVVWFDKYLNRNINLLEKILILKEKYNSNNVQDNFNYVNIIIGSSLLIISLYIFIKIIINGRKNELKHIE